MANLKARSRAQQLTMQEKIERDSYRRNELINQRLRDIGFMNYAGTDYRRRQEIADGNMIQEDQNAMANLPRMARHYEYPKAGYFCNPFFDDSNEV
jgi:hypothetical protein